MAGYQRVVRSRRTYNQWVANQTLEDYALRFTAKSARRWSPIWVANTALGAISFLALEAIGAAITYNYGFSNAVPAILFVGLLIFVTGLPISYYAVKYGVDIDLLTRGAGFGYIGSTVTSLIYASFTFIFFALEAAIMATALELFLGVPLNIGYLICSLIVIPMVIYGITLISRLQVYTQPLWIVLQLLPFVFLAWQGVAPVSDWQSFTGRLGAEGGQFDLLLFGAASAVLFSLIAQIGEQVDFLRFLPRQRQGRRGSWWLALLAAGPGWIVVGIFKLLMGSFLVVVALQSGLEPEKAIEPTHMYLVAFGKVATPEVAIALTGIFVIVCQIKINVTNSYAGSIAWSNFFSRLTHSHPGRVVWLVFNVVIALTLMELGVYKALERTLGLYSIVAVAWIGALFADLVINKPLGLSPPYIEFKRAHLYDINPVGLGSMTVASLVAFLAYAGVFGETAHALASYIALFTAIVLAPLIAYLTGGRFYIARDPVDLRTESGEKKLNITCCICEHTFEHEDMTHCPVYTGPICSLCCSLDARCEDDCKDQARWGDQISSMLHAMLPNRTAGWLGSRVGIYLGVMLLTTLALGGILYLVYVEAGTLWDTAGSEAVARALTQVFFILLLISGVMAWLFVLVHESRKFANEETRRQTGLLMKEIRAHKRTDAKLEKAKEAAEAANQAKSRYVVGISHELRSPLNAIAGYAQLLRKDPTIPAHRRDAVKVIQHSADHLAGLIEGLLDISKIEAGHLTIYRERFNLHEFLNQIVDMFRLQTDAKALTFSFLPAENLPLFVFGDEKRLRQVLINLLSNAIKWTDRGSVSLVVSYHSQVAEFSIVDTGIGIAPENLSRIFNPFERVDDEGHANVPGTGLGLTITKLLSEIMGGDIQVTSEKGKGSTFKVRILLSAADAPSETRPVETHVDGYEGAIQTVMVVDDDPAQRSLIRDFLAPLGFKVLTAPSGRACLEAVSAEKPNAFLLDISMPGMSGWDLARTLRENGQSEAVIIMISANADDSGRDPLHRIYHDDYLVKPVRLKDLQDKLQQGLKLVWRTAAAKEKTRLQFPAVPARPVFRQEGLPSVESLEMLRQLSRLGYVRGIRAKLDDIEEHEPNAAEFVGHLRRLIREFDLTQYDKILEGLGHDHERS
ncbi:response regulator [Roseibium denhamense]|uniref:histidine kinase n=1 Tax=Roseibium denhamense TaxID=76305 RepID=A0ABY1PIV1_9HYPH|nr:ATP-binding protein [Roseibium denhamense]MTI05812.1 response regulator [Roseibium denhamense]SMP35334.1 Signal transduction histidine kinase [Roseibium denhamense]